MIRDYEKKIVEEEIARLERAYANAQDRYAVSGSASSDRTMTKYSVLRDVLEDALTGNREKSQDRMLYTMVDQLKRIRTVVEVAMRARTIEESVGREILDITRR